jgi:flagellin
MSSQIAGLDRATLNANDGISMTQTAEGGLSTATDLLQRMRTLAVQAANGTNSASDRASLQSEVTQLQQELNRVANTTQFNGQNVLDGTLNNAQFQVGANANQTINFSIGNAQATAIGNNGVNSGGSSVAATAAAAAGAIPANTTVLQTLTLQGNGTSSTAVVAANSSAFKSAAAVNAASGSTGVTAVATTTAKITFGGTFGTYTFTLQGAPKADGTTANPVTVSASVNSSTDLTSMTAAINAKSGITGITAVADTTTGAINLTQAAGHDIGVVNSSAAANTMTLTGSDTAAAAQTLTAGGNNASSVGGSLKFSSSSSFAISTTTAGTLLSAASLGSTLSSVATVDLTTLTNGTPSGANDALQVIDSALANINSSRAALGALQNRFTTTISNLQTTSENLNAARSRIQDTDFASETANLTRGQILQQAGTAMLAQANALPNGVLTLLR